MRLQHSHISLWFMAAVLFSCAVSGQDTQGLLKGRVIDGQAAVIPAATIEVRNEQTLSTRGITSQADGYFIAPNLQPGTYTVTVTASGFQKYVRRNVVLESSQPLEITVQLAIGDLTESITVSDDGLEIDTAKGDRTWTLRGDQLGELPIPDRNMLSVLTQVPGVSSFSNSDARGFTNEDVSYISVNGGSVRMNSFQLDGSPNNVSYTNGITPSASIIGNNPVADAVKEVKVVTNVYDAQTGRTAGAVIQVNLKSGGNELHGSAYEYAYRTWLEANTFQNNANNRPRTKHILDQTGFTLGGPVLLPRLFNGRKHRTYFFTTYEYFRDLAPNDHSLSVPEPAMLSGDFSKLTNNRNQLITIYDPVTGKADAAGNWVRSPFAGNVIPPSRSNPVAQKILGYMAKSNQASATGNYSASNLFFSGTAAQIANYWNRAIIKFDQEIGNNHRASFRVARDTRQQDLTNNAVNGPGSDSAPRNDTPRAYAVNWNTNFSPTLFGSFRISANQYQTISNPRENFGFDKTSLGFPASLTNALQGGPYFGRYDFTGYTSLGSYAGGSKSNNWAFGSNITKVLHTHTLKTGLDFQTAQNYTLALGNPLQYSFTDVFTRADFSRADGLSGNAIASALLGAPATGQSTLNARLALLSKYFAGYIQDDWKVTRSLTLNLGFRYDYYLPVTERYDRILANFDSSVASPLNGLIDRQRFPSVGQLQGGVVYAGGGQPRSSLRVWPLALQPRFGFAWELKKWIVLRGGFGRNYWSSQDDMYSQYGYSSSTSLVASLDNNQTPRPDALINPFPSGMVPAFGNSRGLLTQVGSTVNYQRRDFSLPYQDQYSINFQLRPHRNGRLEVGYVRTRTYDMRLDIPVNENPLDVRQKCNPLEGGDPAYCNALLPNPFQGLAPFLGTSRYTATQLARSVLTRPMPQFDGITAQGYNLGRGWYDALQSIYEVRTRSGIVLNASYTFSKNIQLGGAGVGGSGVAVPRDPLKLVLDRSPNFYNRPHVFTFAGVAELPFGRGKYYFANSPSPVLAIVSGWQISSRFDLASGILVDMPSGGYVRSAKLDPDWHSPDGRVQIWRPCAAQVQDRQGAPLTLIDRGFNQQYGCTLDNINWLVLPSYAPRQTASFSLEYHRQPNLGNVNMALNRNLIFHERYKFTIRAEAYNLFNRYLMFKGIPSTDPNSSLFGTIVKKDVALGQTIFPRRVSVSLKFSF